MVHNVQAHIKRRDKRAVADTVHTIFNQLGHYTSGLQLHGLVKNMRAHHPKAARLLVEAEENFLVYKTRPRSHWRGIHSPNPLERFHKNVKSMIKVVGVFPDRSSVFRLVGRNLNELDGYRRANRNYSQQESMQ